MTQGVGNWTFNVLPCQAGRRSEKQSPWYDMATAAVAMIARPYIPQGGKVYDLGCAAGNVGRVLAPTLHEREAQFVALDCCRDVVVTTAGREGPLWRTWPVIRTSLSTWRWPS